MPVGHVDEASPVWISQSAPLLERCTFCVVAASVRKNFKEFEELVEDARKILTDPKRESKRLTGSKADQDEFFDWIDSGMPPESVMMGAMGHDGHRRRDYGSWKCDPGL